MSILKKLLANKLSALSLLILALLYTLVFAADYIAPYDPLYQNPLAGYAEPTKIHIDSKGLYIYRQEYKFNKETFKKETHEVVGEKFRLGFFHKHKLVTCSSPAFLYLLGTDQLGRDLFSRLIHGARPSMTIGFIGLLIAYPLGILYGGISGYFGAWVDNLMMRIAEAIMSLPSFYLLIILSALLPANLTNTQRFTLITFILSFISWAGLSRIVRGIVLSIKQSEYVEAAKIAGQSELMIIIKHILPHTASFLIIAAALAVPGFIIGESALSFLGLGINQPDPSWGNILTEAKSLANILTRPWLIIAPSVCIFGAVFSFNMLGDHLRDILDPKSVGS